MDNLDVYNDLTLHISIDHFYIEPKQANQLLIINRNTEVSSVETKYNQIPNYAAQLDFCGLLGCIKLVVGKYLIVALQREFMGYIAGHAVWQLVKCRIIPYASTIPHSDDTIYLSMVQNVLDTPHHYFSYSYDLTHSMQRLKDLGPSFWNQALAQRADVRFLWNGYLLKDFIQPAPRFCLPLIQGFVSINQCMCNSKAFMWSLVSRRSVLRAGTRFFRRGIDRNGHVANFVETEQIIEYQGSRASFVQIRGSVPLFWSQLPNLRYKPSMDISTDADPQEVLSACQRHLEFLMSLYGRQVLIDLVDHHGGEGRLELAYKQTIQQLGYPGVRYEPFDFHAECRKMKWHRLSILIDRLAHDQDEMGFLLILSDGSFLAMQDGVFRTNCIDCLDRTNVVQSLLAHRNMENVLRKLDILGTNEQLEGHRSLETLFKNVWADHADIISIQYSGTGALKTDFTRTGKRTKVGLMRDGINSAYRYYKNNFSDGFRQDSIDLFHGQAPPVTPFYVEKNWKYVTFPSIWAVAAFMFIASAIFPARYSTESLLYLLFWGSMVTAITSIIFKHGNDFVNYPRLTYTHQIGT